MDTQGNTAADAASEFGPAIHQPAPKPSEIMSDLQAGNDAAALRPRLENITPRTAPVTAAEQPAMQPKPAVAAPQMVFVLDMTTTVANDEKNPRKHEQFVDGRLRPFYFQHGKPLSMPWAMALRFLKHDGFKLTNENGELLEYQHRPRQPDEYGAGERFKLAEDEVIARYDELSTMSLYRRALELPGGEQFENMKGMSANEARAALVGFIKKMKKQMAEANKSKEPDKPVSDAAEDEDDETDFT